MKTNRAKDQIGSLHEPCMRSIVCGKVKMTVEFGAKLSVSLVDSYGCLEKLSWDASHESGTLKDAGKRYRTDLSFLPRTDPSGQGLRTWENLRVRKGRVISLSCPVLGWAARRGARRCPMASCGTSCRNPESGASSSASSVWARGGIACFSS